MTKEGYTFAGWYANEELTGTAVTEITATETGAKTYWAKWTANTYTITFVTNGGTFADGSGVSENTMTYTTNGGQKLPVISKNLHTFDVWEISNAEGGWQNQTTINAESLLDGFYGNVTLTAKWNADFTYAVEEYKYAPDGYVMLRIATDSNTNSYKFGEQVMYYTDDSNYVTFGTETENGAFVTLIPVAGNVPYTIENGKNKMTEAKLTEDGIAKISQTTEAAVEIARDGKVNKNDNVVNIADANAVYQMVINGGGYYGELEQLEVKNRLEADVSTAPVNSSEANAAFRGSLADVHAIVDLINSAANTSNS